MHWIDTAILLSTRKHGESAGVVAMLAAEGITVKAADEHLLAFHNQMREKFGVVVHITSEPYLEYECKRFALQLLQRLEKIAGRAEKLLSGKSDVFDESFEFDRKSGFDKNEPVLPQLEDRIVLETSNMKGRLKQALDKDRQQAVGITHYVRRTEGDDRVRPEHARNDGQVFAWDDAPDTGHPGEDFGCRCDAEPSAEGAGEPRVEVANLGAAAAFGYLATEILMAQAARLAALGVGAAVIIDQPDKPTDGGRDKPEPVGTSPAMPDPEEDPEDKKDIAEKIANGHAYNRHVEKQKEFPEIKNKDEFKEHIEDVMNNPDEVKQLKDGRTGYWDNETGTTIVHDPSNIDGGTALRPTSGKRWFDRLD